MESAKMASIGEIAGSISHEFNTPFALKDEGMEIEANIVMVEQVLVNLISNSLYAVKDLESKWIRIEGRIEGDFYQIKVIDSGDGIEKSIQKKMFDPFFTTKPFGEGTGIGLGISINYILGLGGELLYDDKADNTTFASSFVECFVDGKVLQIKSAKKILFRAEKITQIHTGFGDCSIKKGEHIVSFEKAQAFKKGQKLHLKYHFYEGLGPNGPVTGTTWSIVSK